MHTVTHTHIHTHAHKEYFPYHLVSQGADGGPGDQGTVGQGKTKTKQNRTGTAATINFTRLTESVIEKVKCIL